MASSMAQVEPLPLVPPTVITGQAKRSCMRSATALTRSRPSSMVLGCNCSHQASHSARVFMAPGLSLEAEYGPAGLHSSTTAFHYKVDPQMCKMHIYDSLSRWMNLCCTLPT